MPMSTIPFLFAAQIAFLIVSARNAASLKASSAAFFLIAAFCLWGAASANLAWAGIYETEWFLKLLPGLWLPAIPFLVASLVLLLPVVRTGLVRIADTVPAHWLVGIQTLRIAALGTLIKTIQGDFPVAVEIAIGLNDLLYGFSALWLFLQVRRNAISPDALVIWHLVGVLIILVPGGLAIQSGLPGTLQVFKDHPTSEVMFDWPMVMAPSLVVPAFLLLNIFAAFAALRARHSKTLRKDTLS